MTSVPQAYRFYFILNLLFYSLILFLGCSTNSSSEEDLLSFTISLSVEGQGTVAPESDSYDRNALILFKRFKAKRASFFLLNYFHQKRMERTFHSVYQRSSP